VVVDAGFSAELRGFIESALEADARRLHATDYASRSWRARVTDWIAYGLVRAATLVLARGNNY